MNIENDLAIDKFNLDEEVQKHSSLFYMYSDKYNEEKKNLSTLELQLDIRTATVASDVRNGRHPKAKEVKVTEGAIKEILETEDELIKLKKEIIGQKAYVQQLGSVVDAFQQRKYMLIKLIDLYLANYFSEAKPSKKHSAVDEEQLRGLVHESN